MNEQTLREIAGFVIVTNNLARLARFYCDVLGFAIHGDERVIRPAELALLGVVGSGRRRVLSLGRQTLWIDQSLGPFWYRCIKR